MTEFAFVFPGQGSQSVGMLDAWGGHPAVRRTLDEASAVLDEDLAHLIHAGPQPALDLTANTQPVMLTAAIACYSAWRAEGGPEPAAVAGHSLGEYTALVVAGALSLSDALPLVRLRGQAMQDAVPAGAGAMAAILGLDADVVAQGCAAAAAESGDFVAPANFNDPRQTVIAGGKAGVHLACEKLKALGAKRALLLPVSAPFHTRLMRPAAEVLRRRLAQMTFNAPRIPVINNIDVAMPTDTEAIRDALYRQAFGAVRWVEVTQALRTRGLTHIFECGPGKVLSGLVKRIDAQAVTAHVQDPASLAQALGLLA